MEAPEGVDTLVRRAEGDLWVWLGKAWIVVPTNIGWGRVPPKDDAYARVGPNPMKAGVALGVSERFPVLPLLYGHFCQLQGASTPVVYTDEGLILFPTKSLKVDAPWKSWDQKASLELLRRSINELTLLQLPDDREVALPLVGCGAGKLAKKAVLDELKVLGDRFVLVSQPVKTEPLPF